MESQIFPPTTGGGQQMAKDMEVPFIGKIPLDPRIGHKITNCNIFLTNIMALSLNLLPILFILSGQCCDEGRSYFSEVPDSPATKAYQSIIEGQNWIMLDYYEISFMRSHCNMHYFIVCWIIEIRKFCSDKPTNHVVDEKDEWW